jgi:cytochrome c oxidase subunit 2
MTEPTDHWRTAWLLLLLPFAVASCNHPYASVFSPGGPAARAIGRLGEAVLFICCIVALVVLILLTWGALRRKGSLAEHESPDVVGGQRWLLIGGFLAPAIILGSFLFATLRTVNRFPLHDDNQYRTDIRIVGRQWWWEVQYEGDRGSTRIVSANEVHIPTRWPVEIALESRDVIHSFWVPALHGKVDLIPGHPNRIQVEADVPGRYEGECAEFCGAEHTLMKFTVIAQPLEEYERWLAHEAEPALPPPDPEAAVGQALFEARACSLCHRVRGSAALATYGPDLTHLATRQSIAANSYPNSRAYLEAWVTHAQSLKPDAQMPNLSEFSGTELQAISHYLGGLK